tara:strand:- start:1035 stop:1181 length:147 start_codon:yes stop_codon:yes gene_type:complete
MAWIGFDTSYGVLDVVWFWVPQTKQIPINNYGDTGKSFSNRKAYREIY